MSRSAVVAVVILLLAGVFAAGYNLVDRSAPSGGPAPFPEDTGNRWSAPVTMGEYGFDTGALSALPPGLTPFEVVNGGRRPHELQMFKMEEGADYTEFVEIATSRGLTPELLELASPVGGVGAGGGLAPGESQRFTVNLDLGVYAFASFVNNDHRKGMLKKFDILKGEAVPAALPTTAGTITMVEMDFQLPSEQLSPGTYDLVNEGEDVHEAAIFELDGEIGELREELKKGDDSSGAGGFSLLAPGRSSFAQLNLPAGNYAFVCRMRDEETKEFHFEQGMVRPFEVL